jgi:pSer/pThr/pTyr-binding forkhead associated (FHA) protein
MEVKDDNVNLIYLKAIEGPMKDEHFVIKCDQSFLIGRSKNANLCMSEDSYVSRSHAKILLHNGEMFIEDLASKNGTYLNNQLLKGKKDMKIGDEIKIGKSLLKVLMRPINRF